MPRTSRSRYRLETGVGESGLPKAGGTIGRGGEASLAWAYPYPVSVRTTPTSRRTKPQRIAASPNHSKTVPRLTTPPPNRQPHAHDERPEGDHQLGSLLRGLAPEGPWIDHAKPGGHRVGFPLISFKIRGGSFSPPFHSIPVKS